MTTQLCEYDLHALKDELLRVLVYPAGECGDMLLLGTEASAILHI